MRPSHHVSGGPATAQPRALPATGHGWIETARSCMLAMSKTVQTTPKPTYLCGRPRRVTGASTHDAGVASRGYELVLRLWPRATSCPQARHAVRTFCFAHALPHLADDAELLTSELVTNAIKHTGTLITLVAISLGGELIVNIRDDDGQSAPPAAVLALPDAESGRGIYVVDEISCRWGTTWHGDGKSMWFRLP